MLKEDRSTKYSPKTGNQKQYREELIAESSVAAKTAVQLLERPSTDRFYLDQAWPSEMPIAQIVFPRLLENETETLPTLWAMMPEAEIELRMSNTRYNNFMCTMAPHPMVLWLTVLYNKVQGPRWLPCYLDFKTQESQQLLARLAQTRKYHILFFEKEGANRCRHVQQINIANSQRQLFQDWTAAALVSNWKSSREQRATQARAGK